MIAALTSLRRPDQGRERRNRRCPRRGCLRSCALIAALLCLGACFCRAQGGPPLFTDDPGTPGNGQWEINLGFTTDRRLGTAEYGIPELDINYGAGNRVQLNYQVPWVVQSAAGAATKSGLGNSEFAIKWRFYESSHGTLQISTYPRLQVNNPNDSVARGLADRGTSFLLPVEITRTVGPLDVNGEVGHWFRQYGPDRWIFGLAFGHEVNRRLELLGEVYDVSSRDPADADTTAGGGGRLGLKGPLVLLFMAGRSLRSTTAGHSQFVGYLGLQLLLPQKRVEHR